MELLSSAQLLESTRTTSISSQVSSTTKCLPAAGRRHLCGKSNTTPSWAAQALTSGNLTNTRRSIGLITAHELGHTLSLRHIENATANTPNGLNPIMGNARNRRSYLFPAAAAEFAVNGTNPGELPGEAPFSRTMSRNSRQRWEHVRRVERAATESWSTPRTMLAFSPRHLTTTRSPMHRVVVLGSR